MIFCLVVFCIGVLCLLVCAYFLVRNEWVFNVRIEALEEDMLDSLPDYEDMVYKSFWVWNKDYFLKSGD